MRAASLLAALLLINFGLTLQNVWPTFGVTWHGEASLELAVLVLLLCAHGVWRGRLGAAGRWGLTALLAFLVVARYADVTAPALFGRRIDLYWDLPHVPNVAAMLAGAMPGWQVALAAAGLALLLAAVVVAAGWAVGVLDRAAQRPPARRLMAAAAVAAIAVFTIGMNSKRVDWEFRFAIPVLRVVGEQVAMLAEAASGIEARAEWTAAPLPESDLAAVEDRDVFVVFLESYGDVAFRDGEGAGAIDDARRSWNDALAATGRDAVSAFVDSPTYGGASWLAHASALSGVRIAGNGDYHRLLKSGRETLVDRFRAAGHRTVALVPGVRQEWPEGTAMRFDAVHDAEALAYPGPAFGWWVIPDQYSLDWLWRREVAPTARAPLFVFFPTITSHVPFSPTPPYVADWDRLAAAVPFDPPPAATAAGPGDMIPNYRRSIAYNLRLLAGFTRDRLPADALLIVVGDHQPPAAVSGVKDSHAVPVHVVTGDADLLAAFRGAGFVPGLMPDKPVWGPMERLPYLLLRLFDGGAGG